MRRVNVSGPGYEIGQDRFVEERSVDIQIEILSENVDAANPA